MRFLANGPDIPDALLLERDMGNVVFLCGAGVSHTADLPLFDGLAKGVANALREPPQSDVRKALRAYRPNGPKLRVPLDEVFLRLQEDYGVEEVNKCVTQILHLPNPTPKQIRAHRLIARISTNQLGEPQIVTTNFDDLLEHGIREVWGDDYIPYVAPNLPNIEAEVDITGITYLHGLLQPDEDKPAFYITSSADFGRAYLAEGWATRFVRSLLTRYTVVFIGYQAEDPPVKYLLQGLNRMRASNARDLYVFDQGSDEEVKAKWMDRGVTAIAYPEDPDKKHVHLWQSICAWAERARDRREWRGHVVQLASQGPCECHPHQRGQVEHLAKTAAGAKALVDSNPSPEWLCVLDRSTRVAKPWGMLCVEGDEVIWWEFDPLDKYRLDSDPPRGDDGLVPRVEAYDNVLGWRPGDGNLYQAYEISDWKNISYQETPTRLNHLMGWIARCIDSPIVAWWAMRQETLHPVLIQSFHEVLLRYGEELSSRVRQVWQVILEYHEDPRRMQPQKGRLGGLLRRKSKDWSAGIVRDFEVLSRPMLELADSQPALDPSEIPNSWNDLSPDDIFSLTVEFPQALSPKIGITPKVLPSIFRIIDGHLRRAASMLRIARGEHYEMPKRYLEEEVDDNSVTGSIDRAIVFFIKLLKRMMESQSHRAQTRAQVMGWPADDQYFFHKLKLFALNRDRLFTANEVVDELLKFSQIALWDDSIKEALLHLCRARWTKMSRAHKRKLVQRFLAGSIQQPGDSDDEHQLRSRYDAAMYTKWLMKEQCKVESDLEEELERLIAELPNWQESYVDRLVGEGVPHPLEEAQEIERPVELVDLPRSEVVEAALARSRSDIAPQTGNRHFATLVKEQPETALDVLLDYPKGRQFPTTLWVQLFRSWKRNGEDPLLRKFLESVRKIPKKHIPKLGEHLGEWLKVRFPCAYALDKALAWKVVDHFVLGLKSGDPVESTVEPIVGEDEYNYAQTLEYATISPMGMLTSGLLTALWSPGVSKEKEIPSDFKRRLGVFLGMPGGHRNPVVAVLTKNIANLYDIDSKWVTNTMVPWFDVAHPLAQSAWSGFQRCRWSLASELSELLKGYLVDLFPGILELGWEPNVLKTATRWLVSLASLKSRKSGGIRNQDVSSCLRHMDNRMRDWAIKQLEAEAKKSPEGWRKFFIPFVEEVWPRAKEFRSQDSTYLWVQALAHSGDDFPSAVKAVKHLLVPTYSIDLLWFYLHGKDEVGPLPLVSKYPRALLELLDKIVPDDQGWLPHGLVNLMEMIEESDFSLTGDAKWVRLNRLVEQY